MDDAPAIRADDLVVAYGDLVVLEVEHLRLPRGAVTAVVGPNGAGKTTLLGACSGLVSPVRGSVEVLGAEPGGPKVAHVLQETVVATSVPVTVREVVTMGCYAHRGMFGRLTAEDRDSVEQAMARLGVEDLQRRHLTELSGGQRQRVFVAQGLAQRAQVLLLDEPATGLDVPGRERIAAVLAAERDAGRSVVHTTHSLGEAAAADHVVLLAGRLVAAGPPGAVLVPEHLEAAYEHHMAGSIVLDDPHHGA